MPFLCAPKQLRLIYSSETKSKFYSAFLSAHIKTVRLRKNTLNHRCVQHGNYAKQSRHPKTKRVRAALPRGSVCLFMENVNFWLIKVTFLRCCWWPKPLPLSLLVYKIVSTITRFRLKRVTIEDLFLLNVNFWFIGWRCWWVSDPNQSITVVTVGLNNCPHGYSLRTLKRVTIEGLFLFFLG